MDHLKEEKFELAIGEVFDACFYGIIERVEIKAHISLSCPPMPDIFIGLLGIPIIPSFVPGITYGVSFSTPMSYFDRIKNIYYTWKAYRRMSLYFVQPAEEVISEILGQPFSVMSKIADSAFYFVNLDEFLDFPRPISHKFIYVSGMPMGQVQTLDKKYEDIFENSQNGVIMVSFGSITKSLQIPLSFKQALFGVFAKFPKISFIFKYEENDTFTKDYKNVYVAPWLPQMSLLSHPKLLGFITHGGLNSITESAVNGVPIICIPLFADQMRNCEMMKYRKVANVVIKANLNEDNLIKAIQVIINDKSYVENAKKLADMIKSKPQSAEERIIKYAEFAAKFGHKNNLELHGRYLSFMMHYCLDIILLVIGSFFIISILLMKLLNKIFVRFYNKQKNKNE